jgi:hypothetical protein
MPGEGTPQPSEPRNWRERLLSRAEEWIYDLNARNHWLFRVYDWGNEIWARIAFRGVKRRAAAHRETIQGREHSALLRPLTPDDLDDFAALLASFADFKYLPPHPVDRVSAERALRRSSYLPFGVEQDGKLVAYALVRLFFPRRAATGVWVHESAHATGLGQAAVKSTAGFTRAEGIADYVTVPLDNVHSLRGAKWAGWEVIRTNRHFHVLLRR